MPGQFSCRANDPERSGLERPETLELTAKRLENDNIGTLNDIFSLGPKEILEGTKICCYNMKM
jgi:hypothetical protein